MLVAIFLSVSQIMVSSVYREIDSLEATSTLVSNLGSMTTEMSLRAEHRLITEAGKPILISNEEQKAWDRKLGAMVARATALEKGSSVLGVPNYASNKRLHNSLTAVTREVRSLLQLCSVEFRGGATAALVKPLHTDVMELNARILAASEAIGATRLRFQQQVYFITIGSFVVALSMILIVTAFIVRPMLSKFNSAYEHIATQNDDLEAMNTRMSEQQNTLVGRNAELIELQRLQEAQAQELRENAEKLSRALEHSQQASQVARFSASRFQELFQGIPVPAFTFDPRGTIYEWNQAVSRLFGLQGFEVFQQSIIGVVFQEEERESIEDIIMRVFKGESIQNFEREDWSHGVRRFLLLNFFPLRNAHNEVVGGVCATVDITERKLAEEQLLNYQAQVKEQMGFITEQNVLLHTKQQELEDANSKLEALATLDGLTGLLNHRAFQDELEQLFLQNQAGENDLALILMDVDKFKSLNDEFGHQAGDTVLKSVAQTLRETARDNEIVCRYGGEEFAIICAGVTLEEAIPAAERFRAAIEDREWTFRPVTASFGVAQALVSDQNRATIISRADQSLYAAKSGGRNCVKAISTEEPPELQVAV